MRPPSQPMFPYVKSDVQSSSSCSDNSTETLFSMKFKHSNAPTAEKAKQEPQSPCSLTRVTDPKLTQSLEVKNSRMNY